MRKAEAEVHVSGKGESIHIQRDPMRRRRGYYTMGWTPGSGNNWPFHRPVYDPKTDCPNCKGWPIVPNEEVNKTRSHYMQYHTCPACKGSGKKGLDAPEIPAVK